MMAKIKMIFITMTFCTLKNLCCNKNIKCRSRVSGFLVITDRHTEFWDLGMVLELVLCTRGPLAVLTEVLYWVVVTLEMSF